MRSLAVNSLPPARTPNPRSAPVLRWGVLGTGWIAEQWVTSVRSHTGQQVNAVGSRTQESAKRFATTYEVPRAHGSYEALVADAGVDAVYIATPHNMHHRDTLMALQAGKHVLVEKPIAINAAQASEIAETARQRGLFCAEAMWTLFLPKYDVIAQLLDDGALDEIHTVIADYGEHFAPEHRIMRTDLAGGPLLDLGTYLVMLANRVLGSPTGVSAVGEPAPTGVNGQAGALLSYESDAQAVLHTTLFSDTPTAATIAGSEGSLLIDGPFNMPGGFTLLGAGGAEPLRYSEARVRHDALHFQVAEAARHIAAGDLESAKRPLADSVETMRVLDEIRRQVGVVFEDER